MITVRCKVFIILGFIPLLISWKPRSMNYCGNHQAMPISEILTLDVYEETAHIKLASFKYGENSRNVPRTKDGQVDLNGFFELTTLQGTEAKKVMDVLVNYDFSKRTLDEEIEQNTLSCYSPRNAILFLDNKEQVIGFVELCFECLGAQKYPQALRVGAFCDEKFEEISHIFRQNTIRHGVAVTDAWLLKEFGIEPTSAARATVRDVSSARRYVERGTYPEAIRLLTNSTAADSTNQYAHFYLAHSYFMMKEYGKARLEYGAAIKLDPNFKQAYYERALATIEISKRRDKEASKAICSDLMMVQKLGDDAVSVLMTKYCK